MYQLYHNLIIFNLCSDEARPNFEPDYPNKLNSRFIQIWFDFVQLWYLSYIFNLTQSNNLPEQSFDILVMGHGGQWIPKENQNVNGLLRDFGSNLLVPTKGPALQDLHIQTRFLGHLFAGGTCAHQQVFLQHLKKIKFYKNEK